MTEQNNSLFETPKETPQEQTQGGNPNTTNNPNPLNTLLSMITNERGEQKYRSVEDALVGLKHAQSYIPEVKTELRSTQAQLAELQKQADKVSTLEQTILELTQRGKEEKETPSPSFNEESIASMIESSMQTYRQRDSQSNNQKQVRDAIIKRYGEEKASEAFSTKATMSPLSRIRSAIRFGSNTSN